MPSAANGAADDTTGVMTERFSPATDRALSIAATALSLGAFLVFIRSRLMGFPWIHSPFARAPRILLAAYDDLAYLAAVTLLFLAGLFLWRRSVRVQRVIVGLYAGFALLSLLFALVNVKIVPMLGRPLNYRWLYYSDFLDGQDARNAILAELSGRLVAIAVTCAAGL